MRINIFLLAITLGLTTYTNSQTNEITTKDVFKEIDIVRHKKIIEELKGENVKQKKQAIDSILINPNYYIPPVLYVLSMELYTQDRKEEAAFWFYVAQLRARYDANLCIDNSAKEAVSILNQEYGIGINTYAFQNIDSLEKTVIKVVKFVRTNDENYDHRWINLHGMDAILAGIDDKSEKREQSQPKDKWEEIKKTTIDDYYDGFVKYVKHKEK